MQDAAVTPATRRFMPIVERFEVNEIFSEEGVVAIDVQSNGRWLCTIWYHHSERTWTMMRGYGVTVGLVVTDQELLHYLVSELPPTILARCIAASLGVTDGQP